MAPRLRLVICRPGSTGQGRGESSGRDSDRGRWGGLELTGATRVNTIQEQDAAFAESRSGRPVPRMRLL